MLGLLNAVISKGSGLIQYVKEGLVMANRFLTPPSLSHPANGSAEFDGASDYIQLDTPFSYTNHTIAAWVYVDSVSGSSIIFDQRENANDGFVLFCGYSEARFRYLLNASALNSTTTIQNEWAFIVGTYDGTTQKLYLNGSLDASQSVSQTIDTSGDAKIGDNSFSPGNYFNGNLANVAIWNRALSSDEINSVMWKGYSQLNTSELNGLQAWYSLTESESLVGDDTATLEKYAAAKGLTFEGKTCLQNALNAFPDITDARLYSANYDIRVSADGGTVEALNCVETELNALL